ncbi:hypothetical protein [Inquilinus sp. Marseille-Q2685]|uniref:hypothetical protein n=1 Tax=Inquilinus sp. Marseille-Q2685 TaxID=2866581 RepID=UPI001CE413AD|nr:hypothetical protein [Inquilinus sp. Marseille-Q2685]
MKPCRVSWCTEPASGWGRHCDRHKAHDRRHGHPEQIAITKTMLAPYEKLVEGVKARNAASPAWVQLGAIWAEVVAEAKAEVDQFRRGGAMNKVSVMASKEIVRIGEEAEPWEVVRAALATAWMEADQPRLFRSDDAFRVQLCRRVRALVERNAGIWYDASGKRRRHYKELPRQVAVLIGHRLAVAFGPSGVALWRKEADKAEERKMRQARLTEALEELK